LAATKRGLSNSGVRLQKTQKKLHDRIMDGKAEEKREYFTTYPRSKGPQPVDTFRLARRITSQKGGEIFPLYQEGKTGSMQKAKSMFQSEKKYS